MTVTLDSGSGYTVGSPSSASVTIDEESSQTLPTVTIGVGSAQISEMGGSTAFTVTVNPPATGNLTVGYSIGGTAVNGVDYQTLSGTVTIPAGQRTVPFPLNALDDGDGDESTSDVVTLTLQGGSGYTVGSPATASVTITEDTGGPPPELLALAPKTTVPAPPAVTVAEVRRLLPAAAERWIAAGMDPSTVGADLRGLQIIVTDLPGSALGEALPGRLWIDTNAAGYGWFVDRTPRSDREFSKTIAPTELEAIGGSPAVGHADLLTVVMHELGHLFGLPEASAPDAAHGVMSEVLGLSMRRIPDAADLLLLSGVAAQSPVAASDRPFEAIVDALFRDDFIKAMPWQTTIGRAAIAGPKAGIEVAL